MKGTCAKALFFTVLASFCGTYLAAQELYVGANYHPHDDKNIVKIQKDIRLMKAAGFKVVRMGHLAWDSYEPSEGRFDFHWFDEVMDLMNKAGIKVILDIAVRPAPIWLHQKYPSMDIVDDNGNRHYPNHRYMVDVGDPNYQKYALRYTDALTKRYANHPAILAFGIDNESGDGPISYSETVRKRFIKWLQKKYVTIDSLNQAWSTQRWSRRLNRFEEVGLPSVGMDGGAPEKNLEFRMFISDEINCFLLKVLDRVNANAPGVLTNTNAWYYSSMKSFDYSKIAYSGKMARQGNGFYPGNSLVTNWGVMNAAFGISRIQFESNHPFWCSEFTTMTAVPNSIRKSAYATLMYGNQMVCGWTWQSMWAGEEQYLEGMVDWDGLPNRKYDEYKTIAAEFKKIERFFPYHPKPEVAIAYSYASQMASNSFPEQHETQLQACWNLFYWRNMDANIVEISRSSLKYKLLLIPGLTVMNDETAAAIRNYVNNGGTVIMTSNSALVDATGKVFSTTLPGKLSDVFGIRVGSFEETESMNEWSNKAFKGKKLEVSYKNESIRMESTRFDVIDSKQSKVLARITSLSKDFPIITSNAYGKGQAIYIGLPANEALLNPVLDNLIQELNIRKGPVVPAGVMARQVDDTHFLYLNVSAEPQEIPLDKKSVSLLFDREYSGNFILSPFEPEFVELK